MYESSNFPETLEPEKYIRLLPKIEDQSGKVVFYNEPEKLRDQADWIEMAEFESVMREIQPGLETSQSDSTHYEHTPELVQSWYYDRTVEIEKLSGLVDVALNFAELAIANGCKNMECWIENLRTLFTLVYECRNTTLNNTDTFYTLEFVSDLKDIEKLTLIMSHSYEISSEMFVKNLQEWLLPFVLRRPTISLREKLVREYLIKVSREDLNCCHKLFLVQLKYLATTSSHLNQT